MSLDTFIIKSCCSCHWNKNRQAETDAEGHAHKKKSQWKAWRCRQGNKSVVLGLVWPSSGQLRLA